MRTELASLFALACLLAAPARADLRGDVDIAIRGGNLHGARVAVSILEAGPGPGTKLLGMRADEMMIPASNLKLFTTGKATVEASLSSTFSARKKPVMAIPSMVTVTSLIFSISTPCQPPSARLGSAPPVPASNVVVPCLFLACLSVRFFRPVFLFVLRLALTMPPIFRVPAFQVTR